MLTSRPASTRNHRLTADRRPLCGPVSFAIGAIVLALAFIPFAEARATVIHVPGDYPTIQDGIDAAVSGDVVMVAEGEYLEHITLKSGVMVQGAGDERSIIDGGGGYGDVVSAIGNDIQNSSKVIGFTVTGAISGGGMPGGAGIFCNSGGSPEIANCRFRGNDFGIVTWNNAAPSIHNNVVVQNNFMGIDISSRPTVVNNTIDSNMTGIYDGGGYRPTVMNNIVTRNSSRGIAAVSPSYPPTLSYNDVWGNGQNYYNCNPGTGDISADPLFRDAGAGDYHLSPGSPCIDAGNPQAQYNDPDGTRNDMGAYGGPGAESDAPEVALTDPGRNALDVPLDTDASAVFTVDMDGSTVSDGTFLLRGDAAGFHPGIVTYDPVGKTAMIAPAIPFRSGERVTALLTASVRSAGGAPLAGGHTWQFVCEAGGGTAEYVRTSVPAVQASPRNIATADLNHDGHLDIICGHALPSNSVSVLLGQGDGTFAPFASYAAGTEPLSPAAGDLDRDGNIDVAVACSQGGSVAILLGNGDGSFDPPILYGFAGLASSVAGGDIDADGDLDLVVTNSANGSCSVLAGNGDGSFVWSWNGTVGVAPADVDLGDVNNDGILDLLAACWGSVTLRPGVGDGSFGDARNFAVGSQTTRLDLGDLNGDGDLDVAVADMSGNRAAILVGDGTGAFSGPFAYPVQTAPRDIVAGDLDADGDLDLALSNGGSDTASILRNRGDGTFVTAASYPCGASPYGIASGDLDGDGDLDLGVANGLAGTVSILLDKNALGIASCDPAAMALHVPLETDLTVVFDAGVDPATLNASTVRLRGTQSGAHVGTISYDPGGFTLTFDPAVGFGVGEMLTATLTKGILAQNGVAFGGHSWDFTARVLNVTRGEFGGLTSWNVGNDPRGIQAADFDRDGDIDLAIPSCSAYPQPGAIMILMNRGDGTFAAPVPYSLGAPDPIDVTAADLDGDGDTDLAVVHNEPGSSHLVILKNVGSGTFTVTATYAPVILGQCLAGGDLDADGDVDLVLTDGWGSSSNVKVCLNAGNATFPETRTYSAGTYAGGVVTVDADGDGDRDIAVANNGNGNVSVLYNDGAAAFPRMQNFTTCPNPESVYANDWNGDGLADIACGGIDGVVVILNQGSGSFGAPIDVPIAANAGSVAGADADGDRDLDIVAACADNAIWVALNDGSGSFSPGVSYPVGSGPRGIQAADFNGDGSLDLATPIWDANRADVLYGIVPAGVEEGIAGIDPVRDVVFPNPFMSGTTISLGRGRLSPRARALEIHDITGRLVRTLVPAAGADGRGVAFWDGKDMRGRPVGAGIYFARVRMQAGAPIRIVRVR